MSSETRAESSRLTRRALWAWLWVALCVAVIWSLSGEGFSASATKGQLGPFLRWLFPDADASTVYRLHVRIRKSAHAIEYAVLALLAFRAFLLSSPGSWMRHAALALALVFSVAGIDELHQSLTASRTGSLRDVSLDVAGGLAALALLLGLRRIWRPPSPETGR